MRKSKQLTFVGRGLEKPLTSFGGSLLKGNPKVRRPLDSKHPLHVVLRCEKSVLRLPKVYGRVRIVLERVAERHGVKVYEFANVGNHLHLVIRVHGRRQWTSFIRALSGAIALAVRSALQLDTIAGFWRHRPFTRVVDGWRRAFTEIRDYVELNRLEAEGHVRRREIGNLRRLRALFADG